MFPERWIGGGGSTISPAHFPDLNQGDEQAILWGLKNIDYALEFSEIQDLKHRI
jgi:hypothetical protein